MINILLCGASGKMGGAVCQAAAQTEDVKIVAGVDKVKNPALKFEIYENPYDVKEEIDCIIDFSHPSVFDNMLKFAGEKKIPYIVCTTGLSDEQREAIVSASENAPMFYSANMSVGVNLLIELAKRASSVLEDSFDIEIIEKHHNLKIDAPSGTALAIADAITETVSYNPKYTYDRHSVRKRREKEEIGIHAVRGGTIVGEHQVVFAGRDEVIELNHTATSKEVFAVGAVRAARFMKDKKKGLYNMKDVIDSIL